MRSRVAARGDQPASQPVSDHTGLLVYIIFQDWPVSLLALTSSGHRPNMHLDTGEPWEVNMKGATREARHKQAEESSGRVAAGYGGLAILVGREDAPPSSRHLCRHRRLRCHSPAL